MGVYARGSKTMISQSKMQALVLTTKKLIVSTPSSSWFISMVTSELVLLAPLSACRFSRLAFLRRFSSSEPDANSSDSYSATTCQPSLLLSAIFISFCRLRISCLASWVCFLISSSDDLARCGHTRFLCFR